MTGKQKTELKKLFGVYSMSVLEWMAVTPALDNNEVWDCYEEWQDEDEEN
jgi:hypothetical protein